MGMIVSKDPANNFIVKPIKVNYTGQGSNNKKSSEIVILGLARWPAAGEVAAGELYTLASCIPLRGWPPGIGHQVKFTRFGVGECARCQVAFGLFGPMACHMVRIEQPTHVEFQGIRAADCWQPALDCN